MSEQPRRRIGRPPRPVPRERRFWYPIVEETVVAEISRQAAQVGVPFSTYVQQLLAEGHATLGPFLPNLPHPLPTAVPVGEFLQRVQAITTSDCEATRLDARRCGIHVDKPIADAVAARAHALGVQCSPYIRAVMHVAAGTDARALYRAQHRSGERRVPELAGAT